MITQMISNYLQQIQNYIKQFKRICLHVYRFHGNSIDNIILVFQIFLWGLTCRICILIPSVLPKIKDDIVSHGRYLLELVGNTEQLFSFLLCYSSFIIAGIGGFILATWLYKKYYYYITYYVKYQITFKLFLILIFFSFMFSYCFDIAFCLRPDDAAMIAMQTHLWNDLDLIPFEFLTPEQQKECLESPHLKFFVSKKAHLGAEDFDQTKIKSPDRSITTEPLTLDWDAFVLRLEYVNPPNNIRYYFEVWRYGPNGPELKGILDSTLVNEATPDIKLIHENKKKAFFSSSSQFNKLPGNTREEILKSVSKEMKKYYYSQDINEHPARREISTLMSKLYEFTNIKKESTVMQLDNCLTGYSLNSFSEWFDWILIKLNLKRQWFEVKPVTTRFKGTEYTYDLPRVIPSPSVEATRVGVYEFWSPRVNCKLFPFTGRFWEDYVDGKPRFRKYSAEDYALYENIKLKLALKKNLVEKDTVKIFNIKNYEEVYFPKKK